MSNKKPLSPHLTVYRMQITSALSILHRVSGLFLFIGFLILLWWLIYCIHNYGYSAAEILCITSFIVEIREDMIFSIFKHTFGKSILIIWSYGLFYHMLAGVRHLIWDAGLGFKMKQVYLSGWSVVITSLMIWALVWVSLLS